MRKSGFDAFNPKLRNYIFSTIAYTIFFLSYTYEHNHNTCKITSNELYQPGQVLRTRSAKLSTQL